ncbi:hypothetical protein [Halanaerobacter jeridensis]|nr:hypothetical protein [Halanaerobacter jeridensis]
MKTKKKLLIVVVVLLFLVLLTGIYGLLKPLPEGVALQSKRYKNSSVEFLYDLTYQKQGEKVYEQEIFSKIFEIIEEAEKTIVVDMFLFNGQYADHYDFPDLSNQLTKKLIDKKKNDPGVKIFFITDEINTFYGSY